MTDRNDEVSAYLLIDNGLLQEVSAGYTEADIESRPAWLEPIYPDRALEVSPLLIDVEAAYEAGDLDQVMRYWNARKPALHASIIETRLVHAEIAEHLRHFIFILDPSGKQFTLRFADCAVLAPLSSLLTVEQWATMRKPITNWDIHDRSDSITELQSSQLGTCTSTPLQLNEVQLTALDEASEPDHFIAKVRMMHHGASMLGTAAEQHAWALAARQIWRAENNSNPSLLLFLTEGTLLTRGRLLRRVDIASLFKKSDASSFREKITEFVEILKNE